MRPMRCFWSRTHQRNLTARMLSLGLYLGLGIFRLIFCESVTEAECDGFHDPIKGPKIMGEIRALVVHNKQHLKNVNNQKQAHFYLNFRLIFK